MDTTKRDESRTTAAQDTRCVAIQEINKNLIHNPFLEKPTNIKINVYSYTIVLHITVYFTVQSTAAIRPRNTLYWGVPLLSTSYMFWLICWYFLTMAWTRAETCRRQTLAVLHSKVNLIWLILNIFLQNVQIHTPGRYYDIPTSRNKNARMPIKEIFGKLYWDWNEPRGLGPRKRDADNRKPYNSTFNRVEF